MGAMSQANATQQPLFESAEWTFDTIKHTYDAIEAVALDELGLNVYANQIEVITAEQMLDAYSSIGMPLMYRHWSFGKRFAREELLYRKGQQSLAYEMVINSDPCINYIMEENSMTMQALVLAHAAFGHNHFFKNNYMFRQWTRADAIIDFLNYAKNFISKCEQRYGLDEVEAILDRSHALMNQGVSRYVGQKIRDEKSIKQKEEARRIHEEESFNDLWRTVPQQDQNNNEDGKGKSDPKLGEALGLPEENLLLFLQNHSPKLKDWEREILSIVRTIAQYFYPQRHTKLMNEGCATFVHYEIMNRLYERGSLTEGAMLEFFHMHSAVVTQPSFNSRRFSGINPYALGFAMMRDIQRICEEPEEEDEEWFPDIAGCGNSYDVLKMAWADYRDESFILQFLSPRVMRDFRMFSIEDQAEQPVMEVKAIHNNRGYRQIRKELARQYDVAYQDPDIQVIDADLSGNRRLILSHKVRDGILMDKTECDRTLQYLAQLWGYRVRLLEVDSQTGKTLKTHDALPMP